MKLHLVIAVVIWMKVVAANLSSDVVDYGQLVTDAAQRGPPIIRNLRSAVATEIAKEVNEAFLRTVKQHFVVNDAEVSKFTNMKAGENEQKQLTNPEINWKDLDLLRNKQFKDFYEKQKNGRQTIVFNLVKEAHGDDITAMVKMINAGHMSSNSEMRKLALALESKMLHQWKVDRRWTVWKAFEELHLDQIMDEMELYGNPAFATWLAYAKLVNSKRWLDSVYHVLSHGENSKGFRGLAKIVESTAEIRESPAKIQWKKQMRFILKNRESWHKLVETKHINALQLPFELSAGYVGNIKVEGLVGAVAGWPLEVCFSDVCLVLKPHKVQWDNELLIRYTRELVVAIYQSLGAPSAIKKDSAFFVSPAKWIWNRIQAVGEMTVQMERIHIRVESPRNDRLVAIGLHIPLIRFAPRELEEQILYRRQEPGVTYPKLADSMFISKLLTVENASVYTDLDAYAYWTAPSQSDASSETINHVPGADTVHLSFQNALTRFKECAEKSFARDQRCEIVFIRALWIKLDLKRTQEMPSGHRSSATLVLEAVDIATKEIEINIKLDQIAVVLKEVEHVVNYFNRARTWKWRPSCIDRTNQVPPSVTVLPGAFFPLPPTTDEEKDSLIFSVDKQCKSRLWIRAMWRYAFRCIIDQNQRANTELQVIVEGKEIHKRCWWHVSDIVDSEVRRQRYMHLFARSLTPAAMEVALYGRRKAFLGLGIQQDHITEALKAGLFQIAPPSPRRRPLPEFEALSLEERWELSDLVATMPVYEQRLCRALTEQELRRDYTSAPPSPTRKISSAMEFSVAPANSSSPPHHSRSYSVDFMSESAYQTLTSALNVAINERHHKRAQTVGDAELSPRHVSPPTSRPHAASTSNLPSPTKHEALRMSIFKQQHEEACTISWFEEYFLPSWLVNPTKVAPLLNWQIGHLRIFLTKDISGEAQTVRPGIVFELSIESCSGAMLLSRAPSLQSLVEMRVGLFHMTLNRQPDLRGVKSAVASRNTVTKYKWISTDYIRSPEDGFLYVGLKYSAQKSIKSPGRVKFANGIEKEIELKGKVCIGPIKIDCNEAAMRKAVGKSFVDILWASNMNLSSSTHFSLLRDAYHSFVDLVFHILKKQGFQERNSMAARPTASNGAAPIQTTTAEQSSNMKSAQRIRIMHALLKRSLTLEIEVGTVELNLSARTCRIENALFAQDPTTSTILTTHEDINVMLPAMIYRLQNCPSTNECIIDAAGARIIYQSTKRGRAAIVRHLAHILKL